MCMMSNRESGIDEKNGRFMSLKYCKVHVFHEKKTKINEIVVFYTISIHYIKLCKD